MTGSHPSVAPARRKALALYALGTALCIGGCRESDAPPTPPPAADRSATHAAPTRSSAAPPAAAPERARARDSVLARLAQKPLRYTRHGRCRMACRHIREAEVEALLLDGQVAPNRTRHDGECVSYAVEGRTEDGQDVRIVYADCERETRVVTTIDLGRDWPCTCP